MTVFPQILGVFSLNKNEDIGAGQTRSKADQITYWYARRMSGEDFEIQPLNAHNVPSGLRTILNKEEFLRQYRPEPLYYKTHTVPALETLARKVRAGEQSFSVGDLDVAEREFIKALMIDNMSIEANYGLGEVYSEKQDFMKLKQVLNTLLVIEGSFEFKHRARFNKFGMSLRKNGHHEASIEYYQKAIEVNGDDEHVYFNLARVYLDLKDLANCTQILEKALKINPSFDEAIRFLDWCKKQQRVGAANAS
ncbi:MAG: tetratricopeptide repeat protein [Desulfovibrio sp.]